GLGMYSVWPGCLFFRLLASAQHPSRSPETGIAEHSTGHSPGQEITLVTRLLAMLVLLLTPLSLLLARRAALDLPRRVDAGGHLVRMRVAGEGSPVVLFEIGLGGALEEWAAVQPHISRFTGTVAYDRLGSDRLTG